MADPSPVSDAHAGASSHDMSQLMLDFDLFMAPPHPTPNQPSPFDACIHDGSCLDHHHHARQLGAAHSQGLGQHLSTHQPARAHSAQAPAVLDHGQPFAWDSLLHDPGLGGSALHSDFAVRRDQDCASECGSACDGSCPSQCDDADHGVCCDDDACGSPGLCLGEACQGGGHPCDDESCLAEAAAEEQQPEPTVAMTDGDKAAAAALASFGGGQPPQVAYGAGGALGLPHPPAPLPYPRDDAMSFVGLPQSLPCGSLSFDSMLTSAHSAGFSSQQLQMAFEFTLANHIMQYHDPSRGLAYAGDCLANDPSQFISRCTLPRLGPDDGVAHHYLSQPRGDHECGFQIQDPNTFAHHIFEEHRPALMLHAQQHDPSNPPYPPNCNEACRPGGHPVRSRHISPSPSSLATMSISQPLSTASPSSLATSPLQSDEAAPTDLFSQSMAPPASPGATTKPQLPAQGDDHFTCRWVTDALGTVCGQRFDDEEELQKHCKFDHLKKLKKDRGGFRCGWENCTRDSRFTQRSKVDRHLQVHTGYKPVQCPICGTALSAKQALEQHRRIHTGETPWVCRHPGCNCSFKQHIALTMHERTHTGDKPLECEICGKRFSESSNLSKHRRTHNVKGMHECQLCGKDFHRLDQLRRHMGTNHKDRPAEVDALLSRARNRMHAQRATKASRRNSGKDPAERDYVSADVVELVEHQLRGASIELC